MKTLLRGTSSRRKLVSWLKKVACCGYVNAENLTEWMAYDELYVITDNDIIE